MELRPATNTRRNRPGGWRRLALAVVTVLGLTLGGLTVTAGPASAATRLASFDSQMITLVNQARAANGLPALQQARGLTALSVWWSNEMAVGHTGYQLQHNANAWDQLPRYGASNRTSWGENVAKFSPSTVPARDIFNAYMNSPGHRANILGRGYHYIGMGTMAGSGGVFNTMTFTDKVESGQVVTATVAAKPVMRTFRVADARTRQPVPKVRYSIRKGNCDPSNQVILNTTSSSGAFAMMVIPGQNYCSIPTFWPSTFNKPGRVDFRVSSSTTPVTAWITRR